MNKIMSQFPPKRVRACLADISNRPSTLMLKAFWQGVYEARAEDNSVSPEAYQKALDEIRSMKQRDEQFRENEEQVQKRMTELVKERAFWQREAQTSEAALERKNTVIKVLEEKRVLYIDKWELARIRVERLTFRLKVVGYLLLPVVAIVSGVLVYVTVA